MLNPALDQNRLKVEFQKKQRLLIKDVLLPEAAQALFACLEREVPWGLAYTDSQGHWEQRAEELAPLSDTQLAALYRRVLERASKDFAFIYNTYMMVSAYREQRDPHLVLHRVTEFLNSQECLEFISELTGVGKLIKANVQATRYLPGHFLRRHNDITPEKGRELAYVLNLTRNWHSDWGGQLQFMDTGEEIVDTFSPQFNSLSLFRVPMWHCVSGVTMYATNPRYAITGWFYSK
jgi:SM-20-related protein